MPYLHIMQFILPSMKLGFKVHHARPGCFSGGRDLFSATVEGVSV